MVRDRRRHPARGAVCFRSILFASFSSSLLSFGSSTRTSAGESLCFVTRAPPTHVADHLTARYVPGLSPGDPSCCSPCEAYETAARWTNASVAAIWRVFDERRAETNPGAPAMLDVVDASKLESSTMCSQLIRQPECYALATAFLATLACAPGAANLERATRSVDPTNDEPPGSDVNTADEPGRARTSRGRASPTSPPSPPSPPLSTAHSARFDRREVRLCRSAADDVFAACESVELMGVTDVGAWFGQNPDDFVEIVAGGVKHTTPRLGDVRPVVVSSDSDSDDDEGACYESPRGADRDAWSKDGGWCCDEFPALERCEGEIDYAEYGAVIDNAYAEALRRRGVCPPKA
jgi:hypothetical protein